MAHQPVSPRTYFLVFVALLALTATTVAIAVNLHLGVWEVPVALGIAAVKTLLVGLFFMHLIHTSRLVWLIIAVALAFLVIMYSFTWADYWTRPWMQWRGLPPAIWLGW